MGGKGSGPRGRRPSERVVDGAHRFDRHGDLEATVDRDERLAEMGKPDAPPYLLGYARIEWKRIIKLIEPDQATQLDRHALGAYCQFVALMHKASAEIDKHGVVIRDKRGSVKKNPACTLMSQAAQGMKEWAQELGLTPLARARFHPQGVDDDEFDQFVTGRGGAGA